MATITTVERGERVGSGVVVGNKRGGKNAWRR